LAERAIRIGYIGAPLAGVAIISGFVFQALGKAKQSLILNICRQVIFLLPPLFILPPLMGVDGVWLSFPIVDVGGGILGWYMVRAEMRRWVNPPDMVVKV
jgi:Na+-driven multidrug efflux pump